MPIQENESIFNRNNRPIIGLALGGGIVRGFAHLGVISALIEAGIRIDLVTGSSVGSFVGAMYCAGNSPLRAIEHAGNLSWLRIARVRWPNKGFFSFDRMEKWLINTIGDINFHDLQTPLGIVATDIETGDGVLINTGKLAPAVRASCSIPGFFDIVDIDGRKLGDGSLLNSIPVDAARTMGANIVIGVDLFSPQLRNHWGALGYGFAALEIVFQRAGGGYYHADCLIEPDLRGTSYLRFSQVEKLYGLGYTAGKYQIQKIKESIFQFKQPELPQTLLP